MAGRDAHAQDAGADAEGVEKKVDGGFHFLTGPAGHHG